VKTTRLVVVAVFGLAVWAYFHFGAGQYFSLDYFKAQQAVIDGWYRSHPWQTAAAFFGLYVAVTGLSLPGAAILTLAGGAIFGLGWGFLIVSFASAVGATLAFVVSRFLLRDAVQSRFGNHLAAINRGVAKDGAFYLFTLRLVPAFPFFVINLLMGLTPIRTWTFYWVSQIGMAAGTLVFVNAGTQIAQIETLRGILNPGLVLSFTLLGIFPFIARWIVGIVQARKVYARWQRPARYDNNVVVIGAGSAGLVTSYIAAAVKARVTLIERHRMGGDCLNTGCVPSKALIRSAKFLAHARRAKEFGMRSATVAFDFADAMERVQSVIRTVEPHDSVARYSSLGVDCVTGTARITSPWTVEVEAADGTKRTLTTKHIVIAAGARPFVPPIPGLDAVAPLTSDSVWSIRKLPRRLVVLGGGPIGSELAQCFARFGSEVTQVEKGPRILGREDPEVSEAVARRFREEGVRVLTGHLAKAVVVEGDDRFLVVEHEGAESRIAFDEILCAVGRVPNTEGYGLEELGIPTTRTRTVETNAHLQTLYPNIFACGDVAGPYQFTHTAAHQAWYVAVNALFGRFRKFQVDYRVIPWCTFTDPEVARVGLNETEARDRGVAFEVSTYGIDDLDRAIADGEAHGMIKVLTVPGSDRILGATIVGEHAGDLLVEFVAAMRHGIGLNKILGTIHIYPTLGEANKYAAGVWKRHQVTEQQLRFLEAFQAWQRGAGSLWAALSRLPALIGPGKRFAPETDHT
jgi:pyruvate/2-oxoglutarate dehydrogenase complex dihydrolipoamide dehydrogenase (E3) component/uncharacterized membrane protein YdjX (TVP38/TMEM64 family)